MFKRYVRQGAVLVLTLAAPVHAQSQALDPAFKFFRWDEDYRYLSDVEHPSVYGHLKYLELSDTTHLSFGGSLRERVNHYQNDLFGLRPDTDGELLLSRLLFHGNLHVNENARVFIELGRHYAHDAGLSPGPFDEDELDITQAFVDVSLSNTTLRIGRQEMSLGSTRLVGVRDGPNVRRSFDGFRLDTSWRSADLRLFALQEVRVGEGAWNNQGNSGEEFWGIYGSVNSRLGRFDAYYLRSNRDSATYAQQVADETRHSFGLRAFGRRGAWDWDWEVIYQNGSTAEKDIQAWTAASITGYRFDSLPWRPRIALSTNIASGDKNLDDGSIETFNPLYPNLMYFEEAAILAPQNFVNFEPEVTVYPSSRLSISFDWDFFWKAEKEDSVYVRGLRPLPGTQRSEGRFVTHVPSLSIDYRLNRHISMDLSYSRFFAGEVIDDAGGTDVNFLKLEFRFTF
ncbi:MAG: alginate export family protein [Pseudomonadota bacterium]